MKLGILFFKNLVRSSKLTYFIPSVHFSSVAQSCPTLCDPMNRSTPGLPVHHQLPEFTQIHIHRVSDAIQPTKDGYLFLSSFPHSSCAHLLMRYLMRHDQPKWFNPVKHVIQITIKVNEQLMCRNIVTLPEKPIHSHTMHFQISILLLPPAACFIFSPRCFP